MAQKSILNYFTRTPKTPNGNSPSIGSANGSANGHKIEDEKEERFERPSTSKTPKTYTNGNKKGAKKAKTMRIDSDTDDDDDNQTPRKRPRTSLTATFNQVADTSKKTVESDEEEEEATPPATPSGSNNESFIGKFANFSHTPVAVKNVKARQDKLEKLDRTERWPHLSFEFLKPEKMKDANKNAPSDPDYNPRTLFVPDSFRKNLSPGMKQWWDVKSQNFDTVLFFRVGKFYEMYHMDAVTGVEQINLTFMKGEFAHCGFPESGYSRYSSRLIEKGYKIARVEQTESAINRDARNKKGEGGGKCVYREVCEKATKGVRYASFQDHENFDVFHPEASYLYAIVENSLLNGTTEFGVCFVDTTIGMFNIGQFRDDKHYSRLRTLFSHHNPVQVLYERKRISPNLQNIFQNMGGVRKDALTPETEFWSAVRTIKFLAENNYFKSEDSSDFEWPETLKSLFEGFSPVEGWELGWRALGATLWYTKDCLLEHDLLSLKKFQLYRPLDSLDGPIKTDFNPKYMVLDGITLRNLDIMDGKMGLLYILDNCGTRFGRRLLQNWICMPLARPQDIQERQDAVECLMKCPDSTASIWPMLKEMPDLERLLNKIHYLGSAHRGNTHPDSRAQFYDTNTYSKRKINDLFSALKGFTNCSKIMTILKIDDLDSKLLRRLIDDFPNLDEELAFFNDSFDHKAAKSEGKIIPAAGCLPEYDEAIEGVENVQMKANKYLKLMTNEIGEKVSFFGSGNKRFQMEISEKFVKKVPKYFEFSSQRKGFKRYITDTTKELVTEITQAETVREEVIKDATRQIFEKFDKSRSKWAEALSIISTLDVLMSLARFSCQNMMCRPEVVSSKSPFIEIQEGFHPFLPQETYMPNGANLGSQVPNENGSHKPFILLTGPNMGGKSTYMRQIGILSILAHMGCFVPAKKCRMSVVDRIFTRIGANDNIADGESTFYVEMNETASILKYASSNSLILIDELGRGTATYDGTAIAYAVADKLATMNSRTIFSTHYHNLVESLQHLPAVQLGHMSCIDDNENDDNDDEDLPSQETITFLYKLVEGPCPKSHGFHAARLAKVSEKVIRVSRKKAKEFESAIQKRILFKKLLAFKKNLHDLTLEGFKALKLTN